MLHSMLLHDHFVLNTSALASVFFTQKCTSTNACIYVAFENAMNKNGFFFSDLLNVKSFILLLVSHPSFLSFFPFFFFPYKAIII